MNTYSSPNCRNTWQWGTQAGNGYFQGGSHSIYIADTNGIYNYCNAVTSDTTIIYTQINTIGKTAAITISWDYKGAGDIVNDCMKLVFKKGNPNTSSGWGSSTELQHWPDFYNASITFPANGYFNNSIFYIGFMFVCNSNTVTLPSFAFDNLLISIQASPLSIDTTQVPPQQQHYTRDNPIEAIYNLNGQAVNDTSNGFFIVKRKYSTEKIIKQ
jgi:hypothetical protein